MPSQPPSRINTQEVLSDIQQVPIGESTIQQEEQFVNDNFTRQVKLEYIKTIRVNNKTLKQNNKQRKKYAGHIFAFTCIWAIAIMCMIGLQGLKYFELSEPVLITLISTTTVNFFGFFLLVVKYLFNTNSQSQIPEMPKDEG